MSALARHQYEFGGFTLDPTQSLRLRDGKVVALTPKVFETLQTKRPEQSNKISYAAAIPGGGYWQKMLELTNHDLKADLEAARFRMVEIHAQVVGKALPRSPFLDAIS